MQGIKLLGTAAALAMMGLVAPMAMAETATIKVSLWDKGADKEMVMTMGMDATGDHAMANMGISLSQDSVKAGSITFEVKNDSKETVHEMLIVPLKGDALPPFNEKENEIDEDTAAAIGEVGETEAGKTGSATFDLAPGKYLLSCNIPGHYKNGMWTVLTVE